MAEKNISMVRGDTLMFGLEFDDLEQDLDSAYFTVRKSYQGKVIFQKSLGDGITKTETGKYSVRIAPEDTASLDAGKYYYDLPVGVADDVYTILIGVLTIEQDVTY